MRESNKVYLVLWVCVLMALTVIAAPADKKIVKPPPATHGVNVAPATGNAPIEGSFPWEQSGYHEGDIVLTSSDLSRNGLRDTKKRWTDGVVPYFIDDSFNDEQQKTIMSAIDEYHKSTCIRWRPYEQTDENWVEFKSDQAGCFSPVGMNGGGQVINLNLEGCVWRGTAIHEMLHALGFYHEQSSSDRDKYVKILTENIKKGKEHNFIKYGPDFITDFGVGYDYGSIMHYSNKAFSKNGKPTMVPVKGNFKLGQDKEFSEKDLAKLAAMYKDICQTGDSTTDAPVTELETQ